MSIFKTDDVVRRSGENVYLEYYMWVIYKTSLIFSFRTLCIVFVFLLVLPFPLVSSFIIQLLLKTTFVCFARQPWYRMIIHLHIQQNNVYSILVL